MAKVYNFTISNEDIIIRFSCPNHNRRIEEIVKNLCAGNSNETDEKKICRYTILEGNATFTFDGIDEIGNDIRHEVVFFENTEYPLIVKGRNKVLEEISLAINDHQKNIEDSKSTIISDNGELYGSMNFRNQVGMTDMTFTYKVNGQTKKIKFMTEVLSYKLDYRTDLKTIISDIENEYALLSASFLKDTYLSMRQKNGESSSLIWWQIFKSCYQEIIKAAKIIIDRPKRRLRTVARYERAERMAFLPRDLENEYQTHKDNPAYLYRTEEMILSHDTIENRFLKHAINEMLRKFLVVKEHIITAMHLDNPMNVDTSLTTMESEMLRLRNHLFFRGVGVFKGFTQDNLVMKQALGYKTIMEKWVELQQGYELEEGLRKLEVKDVCDLYEIWCFIKVKNIVQDTLKELGKNATPKVKGRYVTKDFIPQLVYGGTIIFEEENGVELACVSYNVQVEKETSNKVSFIEDTDSMTTVQRPDIVLSLSKTNDNGMKYTYLFDAKYRINDTPINGNDVPPEDAINQMHRYRDAIYYTKNGSEREDLKKEVIAGYVLFPGRVPLEALDLENGDYHYQVSNRKIGIGAFPLRPSKELREENSSIIIDPTSSELALRKQIRKWLEAENGSEQLLEQSIPQKGLEYIIQRSHDSLDKNIILVGCLRSKSHRDWVLANGKYNIRLDMGNDAVDGAIKPTRDFMNVSHVLLYNEDAKTVDHYFDVDTLNNEMPETYGYSKLKELLYPFNVNRNPQNTYEKRTEQKYGQRAYMIYNIEPIPIEFQNQQVVNMESLLEKYINEDTPIGTPFVVRMKELMEFLINK